MFRTLPANAEGKRDCGVSTESHSAPYGKLRGVGCRCISIIHKAHAIKNQNPNDYEPPLVQRDIQTRMQKIIQLIVLVDSGFRTQQNPQ